MTSQRRRIVRTAALAAVAALSLPIFGGSVAIATPEESEICGPFGESVPRTKSQFSREGGILASAESATRPAAGAEIVKLPGGGSGPAPNRRGGEALLALPKGPGGSISTDFELGPQAIVAESFFSPVICSTVVRILGPQDAAPEDLVAKIPKDSVVAANDVYMTAADTTPLTPLAEKGTDPYLSLQHGLERTGVERARSISDGSGARIALLDSRPDPGHRDLPEITDVPLEPGSTVQAPPGVHGTLMAGVLAAREGNDFGIAGVAPGAEVISIPICTPAGASSTGQCTAFDVLRGLDRAWESEAQVVNLSISGPANALIERGVARLDELGAVVVAAAGNEGTETARYPAAYPSVIGVAAMNRAGTLYERSNRGSSAELIAPGVEILSTVPGDVFAFGNGTSLAAAHVSGMLAILVASGHEAGEARAALFRSAYQAPDAPAAGPVRIPPLCDALAILGKDCASGNSAQPAPAQP